VTKLDGTPVVSVITPCLRGEHYYQAFFDALSCQTVEPHQYEVVVIDNGSPDTSFAKLQQYATKLANVHVLQFTDTRGSYAARNFGVNHSSGDILAFTDIDCVLESDWLEAIISHRERILAGSLLSGPVILFPEQSEPNIYEAYDMLVNLNQSRYSERSEGATANLAVARRVFDCVGGFADVESGGDLDFCRRCATQGNRIYYESGLKVNHPARSDYKSLASKERRKGRGIVATAMLSGSSLSARFMYLIRQLLGLFLQPQQWRLVWVMIKSQGLGAYGLRLTLLIFRLGWVQRWTIVRSSLMVGA